MSGYPEDIRMKALTMMKEVGVRKTSNEMHIGRQTLYKWRNAQTENNNLHNTKRENYTEMHTPPDDAISAVHENPRMSEIEKKLKSELEDMQRQNNTADETIDYLVSENRQLRQRCERYLKALSLLVQ